MHAIKSRAKRAAWTRDDDATTRWIPYANRHRTRHTPSGSREPDVERDGNVITHSQSSPTTRVGSGVDSAYQSQPNRASTEPAPYSAITEESAPTDPYPLPENSKQTTGTSETLTKDPLDDGARKRHSFLPKVGSNDRSASKAEQEKDAELGRTNTAGSKKSKVPLLKKHIPVGHQLKAIFWTWPNILLVCVPIGIAINYSGVNPLAVFVVNFLAIIPLAAILSFATEEIALRVGPTIGGLLNASFGNATELIVAIIALVKDEIIIVQTSLVGSMLSNLLLVMGMCFFCGGYNRMEQYFNVVVAQTASSLLALAAGSLIIPTVFVQWSNSPNNAANAVSPELSRGTAIILLVVYGCYLLFQLKTHIEIYNTRGEKSKPRTSEKSLFKGLQQTNGNIAGTAGGAVNQEDVSHGTSGDEDEEEDPQLSFVGALLALCIATALIGVCSEYVVDSIGYVTNVRHVPQEFVGLILLPIVGNAAEHATAVTVAIKDKMDLAIGVAVGSSMQIALLVLPLSVVIGWIVGAAKGPAYEPMTLNFDGFVIAVLFVSVLLVNYLISDGKSHWLEGVMLMTTYIIIAVAAWFYPQSENLAG